MDGSLALPTNINEDSGQWVRSIVNDDSITTGALVDALERVTDNEYAATWDREMSYNTLTQGKREFTDNFNEFKKLMTGYLQHGGSRNGRKLDNLVQNMRIRDAVSNDHDRINYASPFLSELLFDAVKARTYAPAMPNAFRHLMHAGAAYADSERKARKIPARESREPPGRLRRLMREARSDMPKSTVQTHKKIRPGTIVPLYLTDSHNVKRMRSRSKQNSVPRPRKKTAQRRRK